jgi:hypothetical protein
MTNWIAGEAGVSKQQAVADALNRLIAEIGIRCEDTEGIRDYFHIAALGYGSDEVSSLFGSRLDGSGFVPISQIIGSPLRTERRTMRQSNGAGGIVEIEADFETWVDPSANGRTPMVKALGVARDLVRQWVVEHPNSYPPIVLNLTDGEATDGDPLPVASQIVALGTEDGQALLFNLHLSHVQAVPIAFPDTDNNLPDAFARALFAMSSVLPPKLHDYAKKIGYDVSEQSRGFVYNADIVTMVQFMDIGTRREVARR